MNENYLFQKQWEEYRRRNRQLPIAVKVLGNLEKTHPATWKTDAFYGNPLTER